MPRKFILWAFVVTFIGGILLLLLAGTAAAQTYTLPADRTITWYPAGLDVVGGIPNYANVTCTGLDPTGAADATSRINTCITAAASGTAVYLPAGSYKVSGDILMKSNVVLRGATAAMPPWLPAANAAMTTLNTTNGARIYFNGGSKDTNFTPSAPTGTAITAGYTQGSTLITVSSASSYSIGDYISIYQNKDASMIADMGLTYLGEDCGGCSDSHVLQQYSKITNKSGNDLTIDPPIYYVSPAHTGQSIRKQTFNVVMAGLENLRLNGNATSIKYIFLNFTRNCWVKGVETYNVGQDGSGSPHIWTSFSYANEIRDSYFHHGVSRDSGRDYGTEFYMWNSRHKVENVIMRDIRHAMANEGGNAGTVFLYNYTDDNGESVQGSGSTPDTSFLGEDNAGNHGAHPHMNLYEGNNITSMWFDYTQGSSSHNTMFRNYVRCKNTVQSLDSNPWAWSCIEIENYNRYYNIVGNVIGLPSFTSGTLIWNQSGDPGVPTIFKFGFTGAGGNYADSTSRSTAILHGNYDYVTDSQATWDGGSSHTLASSLYYASKPAFFGSCVWPPVDPATHTTGTIPAKERYAGATTCSSGGPAPPTNLQVSVQ